MVVFRGVGIGATVDDANPALPRIRNTPHKFP